MVTPSKSDSSLLIDWQDNQLAFYLRVKTQKMSVKSFPCLNKTIYGKLLFFYLCFQGAFTIVWFKKVLTWIARINSGQKKKKIEPFQRAF